MVESSNCDEKAVTQARRKAPKVPAKPKSTVEQALIPIVLYLNSRP